MFKETAYQGPGLESMQTYVIEIALMLLGAYLLGYLLRALLNGKYKTKIKNLEYELSKKQVAEAQAEGGLEDLQLQISEQSYKIQSLEKKLEQLENEKRQLEVKYSATINEVEDKTSKLNELEEKLATATWPEVDDKVSQEQTDQFPESNLVVDKQEEEVLRANKIEEPEAKSEEEDRDETEELAQDEEVKEKTEENTVTTASDNLRLIEGIGPKIEQLLNSDGIYTFKQLAEADSERIKAILIAEGPTYAVHDPSTWSEQSRLAFEGKWEQLDALQESLKGGKRR